ncbi:hypothetical protein BT96DRAFT_929860 [Gymnopus androsaceus JB14]|uniref:Nephrocystin 3-like N-terminal domain-containing protein n=1 Tax=Gymnopus androsaceus JB14 TaxID=1447944 RepID=A0A6A4GD86_9AGAR|nr:hypothetical protein BT96DRAFT_929860 [Gymnopus androsaceus JB14]
MSEYFHLGKRYQGDIIHDGGRQFENSSNFQIHGGNFINANDITIQSTDNTLQKIRDWLKAPDCIINFNTAKNKKMKGTGMWITKHPKYIEWKNTGGLLWIQGKAGSGKTVISTTIIDHLRATSSTVWIHYFDFRDNTGDKSGYQGFLLISVTEVCMLLNLAIQS